MAEQFRQTGRSKTPISRHPLFPAIIALWFGALFGLGSLAVRPTLLEELVLAGHIDTLLPATAPPLGMTSRILLALAMALIGGLIGGGIARRISRPKPEVRQRRRGTSAGGESRFGHASGRLQPAFDEDDGEAEASPPANKRRSLAMSEEEIPLELHEYAPLPGGPPQILNLADVAADPIRSADAAFDGNEPDPAPAPQPAPQPAMAPDMAPALAATHRNAETPAPHAAMTRLEQTFGDPAASPSQRFAAPTADLAQRNFDRPAEPDRPVSAQPVAATPFSPPAEIAPAPVPPSPAPIAAPAPPRPFAGPGITFAPAAPVPAEPEGVVPASKTGEAREALALGSHVPLFPTRTTPAAADGGDPVGNDPAPVAMPEPEPGPEPAPEPVSAAFAPPFGSAAERIVAAHLDTLSPVQLVERLAISIQRRRNRADEAPMIAAEPQPAPAMPAPTMPAPVAAIVPPPAPAFAAPLAAASAPPFAVDVVPAPMAMPAALRPISLEEDDEPDFADFLPPRRIGLAHDGTAMAPLARSIPAEPEVAPEALETSEVPEADGARDIDAEGRALDDGYSSLLDLSRPVAARQPFVRIEEPVEAQQAIEPVVVFPGQVARLNGHAVTPQPTPPLAAAPEPREVPQAGTIRRFDAPPAGAAGFQPAPRQDPEEAERALRAALATLQRMSAAS